MKRLILGIFFLCGITLIQQTQAQPRSLYTVLQVGGIIGLQSSAGEAASGYQIQFVMGKNYRDRTFLGMGLGNDVYRGKTEITAGNTSVRRLNTLPLFADFRQFIAPVSPLGHLGFMANGGYALPVGGDYYQGVMAKAGLTYSHMLVYRSDLQFSLAYGFQQFDSRFVQSGGFHQHQVHLTVGLFVY